MSEASKTVTDFSVTTIEGGFNGPYGLIAPGAEQNHVLYPEADGIYGLGDAIEIYKSWAKHTAGSRHVGNIGHSSPHYYEHQFIYPTPRHPAFYDPSYHSIISLVTPAADSIHSNWVMAEYHRTINGHNTLALPLKDEHKIHTRNIFLKLGRITTY